MTDGRIARLTCTARVIARPDDQGRTAALAGTLLRTALPAALPGAIEDAFAGDPTVYVARSLRCALGAGPASTADDLARAVAAELAQALRAPEPDRADIARFPSTADYLAAFLAAAARGEAGQYWYFGPLRHLVPLSPAAALEALAEEGHDLTAIMLALHRAGPLPRLMAAVGEQALARAWAPAGSARSGPPESRAIGTLALDLARALGWRLNRGLGEGPAAPAAQDLDWSDPVALAAALAQATWRCASPDPAAGPVTAGQLPPWVDWADTPALLAGLSAPPWPAAAAGATVGPVPPPRPAVRSPRTVAVEALLAELVAARPTVIDPSRPVTSAVTLWVAVTDRMPGLAEAAWVRDLVTRYVDRELASAGPAPHGLRAVGDRDHPAPPGSVTVHSACAGVYLLFRSLDAIRMPRLCDQSGIPPADLLYRLARHWSGPGVPPDETAAALRPVVGDPGAQPRLPPQAWQRLMSQAVAAADAQCPENRGAPPPADGPPALTHADDDADRALDLIAWAVLRHWAWWLRGFAGARPGYLLDAFIRRPGFLTATADGTLVVTLRAQTLDVVLAASGALAAVDLTWPWPSGRERAVAGGIRRIEFATVP